MRFLYLLPFLVSICYGTISFIKPKKKGLNKKVVHVLLECIKLVIGCSKVIKLVLILFDNLKSIILFTFFSGRFATC
jgi:hypothetical protein